MNAWLGASLLVGAFTALCKLFGLLPGTQRVMHVARRSFAVLGDASLPDETKEKALQANALQLFRLFALLTGGGLLAFALPLAGLWGADRYGMLSWDEVLATMLSWPFLSLATVIMVGVLLVPRRRRDGPDTRSVAARGQSFENRYSTTERWLHEIAFATTPAQVALAEMEDRLYRDAIARVPLASPVFITALPRAGTTLLLELCAGLDEFAAHSYRRMPFVFTPLFWERFSRIFRVDTRPRERAHGDGMAVSVDSPEALEEMLWLAFWPTHYEQTRIRPWEVGEYVPEFREFFQNHMRKLILATRGERPATPVRYVSKNNANIARVRWLMEEMPDARLLIPFREPLQHAASLLRQHRNFLELHRNDDFARRYMAGVGHFDFGANLRPIDFDGWSEGASATAAAADGLEYWLRYWTAAYQQRVDEARSPSASESRVRLVDFDALCVTPEATLTELADFLEIRDRRRFVQQGRRIRHPRVHEVDTSNLDPRVLADARHVHAQLLAHHVV